MAKSPHPALRPYEQQGATQVRAPTLAREVDVSSGMKGIAGSLARAGQAVEGYAATQVDIAREEQRRREDDARVTVTQRMAEIRREANDLRRTVFTDAQDGWRGVDEAYAQGYAQIIQRHMNDPRIDTEEARTLLGEQAFILQQSAQDAVSEQREQARGQWQADTMRATIDQGGNTLIADPTQYDATREDMIEAIAGISDANLRRDTTEYMEESYSRYAVAGLIQANPQAALRALRDPEAEGAYARLSPAARGQAMGQAEAEIERRAARWRAQVQQSVNSAMARMELGLDAPGAPSVDSVRSALGPDVALRYEAARAASTQFGRLSTMDTPNLMAVIANPTRPTDERSAVIQMAEQRAAATILDQRREDPMAYQLRNGLAQETNVVEAFNQGDWGTVNGMLQRRAAEAQQNSQRMGMAPLPLTAFEANVIGPRVRAMPSEGRGAFLRSAAAWMGQDSPSYRALMAQLFPDSPATAYAGYLTGVGGERGARDAALVLRGEDVLGGRSASGEGESSSRGSRNRLLDMPTDDDLRGAFRARVGAAYAGFGADAQGNRAAEAQAFEVFRSAYAGLAEQGGTTSDALNSAWADRAAQIATGGVVRWNGRETLMPPGLTTQQFSNAVRDGFSRWTQLQNEDPREYTLEALGPSERGVRYGVRLNDEPVRSASGRPIEIEVRRDPLNALPRRQRAAPLAEPANPQSTDPSAGIVGH